MNHNMQTKQMHNILKSRVKDAQRWKMMRSVNIYEGMRVFWLTYSIFEVLMSNQFKVLFYGFSGQSVLSENKVLSVDESVDFTHRHV